jgi:hypothetical protein
MRYLVTPDGTQALFNTKGRLIPLSALRHFPQPVMVIDTIPNEPDAEEQFPFLLKPGFRLWHGWWFDEHCQNKKGPGNSWKVHRVTKYRPVDNGGSLWDRSI